MNVRAERKMWEQLPADGEWLSRDALREILRSRCGFANDRGVDAAIGWLVQGQYVDVRDTADRWRSKNAAHAWMPARPPVWEYRRRPLGRIPLEADMQVAAGEIASANAERKATANAAVDGRLRELGLLPEANHQLQEA